MKLDQLLISKKRRYYKLVWLKHDLPAGMTVFLVALPLCLGISLASGAPLSAGIISGIVGGLLVSLLSGSQLAVSGPAAGLTTIIAGAILIFGDFSTFLACVCLAGVLQILFGILKLGAIANYFPSSVIKGMLAAIGIILMSKQIPILIGYDQPDFWREGLLSIFNEGLVTRNKGVFEHFSGAAILTSMLSILVIIYLEPLAKRRFRWLPVPLIVVALGILMTICLPKIKPFFAFTELQLVHIDKNFKSTLSFIQISPAIFNIQVLKYGFTIALLASLETLLCIEAMDKLDRLKRKTSVNRELIAQGFGNLICGIVGGLPMTAVIVRGAANVDAGARTKMSSFTHGLFLLMSVLAASFVLNYIPYASLATILLVTGYNLSKPKLFLSMYRLGWNQFLPFLITILFILLTDLLIGVSIGLLISIYFLIRNNFKEEYRVIHTKELDTDFYLIRLNSMVTFLNKVNLQNALYAAPNYSVLVIDGSGSKFIDFDVLEMISEFEKQAQVRHIELKLIDIPRVGLSSIH